MRGRSIVLGAALLAVGSVAEAQILEAPRSRARGPIAWASLGAGWLELGGLVDGASGAQWDFGSAPQWRASLEVPLGRGASIGVLGTTARVPLTYNGTLGANSCVGCDADANVSQFMGTLHVGGGAGLHQVIEVNVGTTMFSNFRTTGGAKLGSSPVNDWTFGLGYGFGYSMSDRLSITVVQDFGLVIHKRSEGTTNNVAQQRATRIGARLGLGG